MYYIVLFSPSASSRHNGHPGLLTTKTITGPLDHRSPEKESCHLLLCQACNGNIVRMLSHGNRRKKIQNYFEFEKSKVSPASKAGVPVRAPFSTGAMGVFPKSANADIFNWMPEEQKLLLTSCELGSDEPRGVRWTNTESRKKTLPLRSEVPSMRPTKSCHHLPRLVSEVSKNFFCT